MIRNSCNPTSDRLTHIVCRTPDLAVSTFWYKNDKGTINCYHLVTVARAELCFMFSAQPLAVSCVCGVEVMKKVKGECVGSNWDNIIGLVQV